MITNPNKMANPVIAITPKMIIPTISMGDLSLNL